MDFDAIVIGGGAAGLFCARTAGLLGRRVVVLEHNPRLGNKILISGGGRCNFTNTGASPANYITSGSPHFVKSALARFTPQHFLALVEQHGIQWHEKKLGQLFCDHSSKQILQLLEDECRDAGVEIRLGCKILSTERAAAPGLPAPGSSPTDKTATPWEVVTNQGRFVAPSLVIATGALSFPKLGATPFGYDLARRFGIRIVPPRPGLVPLTFSPNDLAAYSELSGIAFDCEARGGQESPAFRENVLFTHRGLSGPSILQASSYWNPGQTVFLNLLPGQDALQFLESRKAGGRDLKAALRGLFPERFLQIFCGRHGGNRPLTQLPQRELVQLATHLSQWQFLPAGDEGYPKAEVTVGGIDTAELSSKTLEARNVPGLFFIGEVVDITGWLGGYNFQWAWSSGHAAAQAL
jgi:hypothetical protein